MSICKLCKVPIIYWENPDFCCQSCLDNFYEQNEFVPKIKEWLAANGYKADTFIYAHDGVGWFSGWSIIAHEARFFFQKTMLSEIHKEMAKGEVIVMRSVPFYGVKSIKLKAESAQS
jgi:hypothetical protein